MTHSIHSGCTTTAIVGIFLAGMCAHSTPSWAGAQVGTLTQVQGSVKLFSHPSKTLQKDEGIPHAFYEGEYFLVQDAKIGDRVEKGNILRTSPGSKGRVVFDNGDQINVGSATAYRVSWDEDNSKGHPEIHLAYGKLRGIVEKGGPRSRLRVKTKSAVMGVRGTDFFIAEGGADSGTEVTIIRGSVEVTPTQPKEKEKEKGKNQEAAAKLDQPKPIEVKAGFSAEITPLATTASETKASGAIAEQVKKTEMSPVVELRQTTQEDFAGIQKSSTINVKTAQRAPSQEAKKNVEILEQKASVTALKDIQAHDQKLFATLEKQGQKTINVEEVNRAAIQNLSKEAPKAPAKHKPYKSEIEDIDDGAYERYFKNIEKMD